MTNNRIVYVLRIRNLSFARRKKIGKLYNFQAQTSERSLVKMKRGYSGRVISGNAPRYLLGLVERQAAQERSDPLEQKAPLATEALRDPLGQQELLEQPEPSVGTTVVAPLGISFGMVSAFTVSNTMRRLATSRTTTAH